MATSAAASERCGSADALPDVQAALQRIEASVDPCGETAEVRAIVQRFRDCGAAARVCVDRDAPRNVTETALDDQPTTVTWNPTLRSALETYCPADDGPLRRDPTASLLHEIVHVVQDCDGLDIAAHELEAVRIENIYRRAARQCQRTGYGAAPLPDGQRVACLPDECPCTAGDPLHAVRALDAAAAVSANRAAAAPATKASDGDNGR